MYTVRILGEVQVSGSDGPLAHVQDKGRQVVVRLACAERGAVTRSRLASDLWPDQSERAGRRRLSETVSRLRRAWGPRVVVADGDTVRLEASCDLARFRSALRVARSAPHNIDALEAVRTSHHGEVAPGVTAEWIDPVRDEVDEGLDWALGGLLTALRQAGRPSEAEAVGRQLLGRDPLRESAMRELLQVLAVLGRSGEALQLFARFRDRLRREHGDEPDAPTLALVRELRRQPDGPAPIPAAHRLPLVDREDAIATLRVLLERSQHGTHAPIALVGPCGSGRTRMLEATARAATWRGFWVIRCGRAPFAESVRRAMDVLARERAHGSAGGEREALALVEAMCAERPVAVLVDSEPHPSVTRAAEALSRQAFVVRAGRWPAADVQVPLTPLSLDGVRTLAREIVGDAREAEAVYRWSGGRAALVVDGLTGGQPWRSAWLDRRWPGALHPTDAVEAGWLVQTPGGLRPACPAIAERLDPTPTPPPRPSPPAPTGDLAEVLGSDLGPAQRSQAAAALAERLRGQRATAAARSVHHAMLAHAGAWPEERARHEAGLCAVALVEDDPVLAAEHLARGEATGALPADIAANLAQRIALAAGDPAAASGPDPDLCARALAADGHTLAATALARDPELIAELAAGRGCAQQAREALDQVAAPPRWLVARVLAAQGRLGDARAALELRAGDPVEAASTAILLGDIRESTLEVGAATLDAALSRRPEALRARWLARWADLAWAVVRHRGWWPPHWPLLPHQRRQPVRGPLGAAVTVVWAPRPHHSPTTRREVLLELLAQAHDQGADPSPRDLGAALAVDPRTVRRDLDALSQG
ncbi:MAG: DNA-binding SARP family transcriptional activator [Myxococcota bacterium]|jgi:DNA-binding SARP family transcriptional activator